MAARRGTGRVLVVDDNQQIRSLVRRALSQHGYQVDDAASLTQARDLEPGGYDALVIDARIGAERGADLIEELRGQDASAPARCLLITGGSRAGLPPDVGCLTKPFSPDDLLSAVQALAGPGPASAVQALAGPGPAAALPAASTAGYDLLALLDRLRTAERCAVADFVHEGPLQDLTAALLELHLAMGDAPAALAGRLARLARQVGQVAQQLRRLIERDGAELTAGGNLADAVHRRASWLVPGPVTVHVPAAALAADGAGAVNPAVGAILPAVAELALFLLAGEERRGPADVSLRLAGTGMEMELSLPGEPGTAPGEGPEAMPREGPEAMPGEGPEAAADGGPPGGGHPDLERLAAALGGAARTVVAADGRRAWITLPGGSA